MKLRHTYPATWKKQWPCFRSVYETEWLNVYVNNRWKPTQLTAWPRAGWSSLRQFLVGQAIALWTDTPCCITPHNSSTDQVCEGRRSVFTGTLRCIFSAFGNKLHRNLKFFDVSARTSVATFRVNVFGGGSPCVDNAVRDGWKIEAPSPPTVRST